VPEVLNGKRGSKAAFAVEVHNAATQRYGYLNVYRAPHHDLVVQGDVLAFDQGYEQLQQPLQRANGEQTGALLSRSGLHVLLTLAWG
jgi:hypothetical protein